jgi:hypothetical protein
MDDIGSRRRDTKSGAYRLLMCRHSILGSLILFSEASYFRCFFSPTFNPTFSTVDEKAVFCEVDDPRGG